MGIILSLFSLKKDNITAYINVDIPEYHISVFPYSAMGLVLEELGYIQSYKDIWKQIENILSRKKEMQNYKRMK